METYKKPLYTEIVNSTKKTYSLKPVEQVYTIIYLQSNKGHEQNT